MMTLKFEDCSLQTQEASHLRFVGFQEKNLIDLTYFKIVFFTNFAVITNTVLNLSSGRRYKLINCQLTNMSWIEN